MSIDQLVDMTDPLYRDGLDALKSKVAFEQESVLLANTGSQTVAAGDSLAPSHDAASASDDSAAIAQIRDMLPDLGVGFIRACLDHYGYNAEEVAAAIFENDLPQSLADMDRKTEQWTKPSSGSDASDRVDKHTGNTKSALESRRNVFDNDEFDIFHHNTLDWSRVHIGKASVSSGENVPSDTLKGRVMQIARRIGEEDEYDDTYDYSMQNNVEDATDADKNAEFEYDFINKPPASTSTSTTSRSAPVADPTRQWEAELVEQYIRDSSVMERKKGVRKTPAREALRLKTGLSDEQLEGWLTIFLRNPRKQQILFKYGWSGGEQPKAVSASKPESAQA
ncbi:hypothetical protein FB639_006330, partial [Coemansia asiatica]